MNEAIHTLGGYVEDAPAVDPATLDPMADEDQSGYIPTIDVIRMVRPHRDLEYIRQRAGREGYKQFGPTDKDTAFDDCVAVEMACREILHANRWMLLNSATARPES
jgi:hypothetical protein